MGEQGGNGGNSEAGKASLELIVGMLDELHEDVRELNGEVKDGFNRVWDGIEKDRAFCADQTRDTEGRLVALETKMNGHTKTEEAVVKDVRSLGFRAVGLEYVGRVLLWLFGVLISIGTIYAAFIKK